MPLVSVFFCAFPFRAVYSRQSCAYNISVLGFSAQGFLLLSLTLPFLVVAYLSITLYHF